MAPHSPTPDEVEQTFIIIKWWRELTLGLIALLSSVALIKKGRNVDTVPIYITDHELKQQLAYNMLLLRSEMEREMREELKKAIHESNEDLIKQFTALLDAKIK